MCNSPVPSGSRTDADYCSSACRQAAYRARQRDWSTLIPDPAERAASPRMSSYTDAQFEDALRLAREQGDLSRDNVLRALDETVTATGHESRNADG